LKRRLPLKSLRQGMAGLCRELWCAGVQLRGTKLLVCRTLCLFVWCVFCCVLKYSKRDPAVYSQGYATHGAQLLLQLSVTRKNSSSLLQPSCWPCCSRDRTCVWKNCCLGSCACYFCIDLPVPRRASYGCMILPQLQSGFQPQACCVCASAGLSCGSGRAA
jgi:hypothetical protein